MFDKFKKLFEKEKVVEPPVEKKPRKEKVLSAKEQANKNNQPYISITKIELDPNDVNNGGFEFDWNEKFIVNLIKAGYKIKPTDTDSDLVDRWFTQVCRNVALEMYEQMAADPEKRNDVRIIRQKDLGDGRTEVS